MSRLEEAHQRSLQVMTQESDDLIRLIEPFISCAKIRATELARSSERADVAAEAAVALCSREYGAYETGVLWWSAMGSSAEALVYARHQRSKIVSVALTLIVRERQRPSLVPRQPHTVPSPPATRSI